MSHINLKKILGLLILGSFIMPVSLSAHSTNSSGGPVIKIGKAGFSPDTVEIKKGQTVTFENIGEDDHWPASDIHPTHGIYPEFDPKRPLLPGETWDFTFQNEGIWRMHDHLYPALLGTITVTGDGSSPLKEAASLGSTDKTKEKGFFIRLWEILKNFFNRKPPIDKKSERIFTDPEALKQYVKAYGPKQTTEHLNKLSDTLGSCHNVAHRTGHIAYELFKERAFKECGSECHSGCYHGATEAFFKENGTAHLSENLNIICNSELNAFFSHQCLHGIGHGLAAWANYDLPEALKSCDLLSRGQSSCWTGVFMENIVGALAAGDSSAQGENTGHVSKYLNKDPNFPCNSPRIEEKYRASCYFLQTDRMMQLFGGDFKKVATSCSMVPADYRRSCFESMGRTISGTHHAEPEKTIAACNYAPSGDSREGCLMGAAQDTFWDPSGQDAGLSFCKLVDKEYKVTCFNIIFSRAPQVLTSKVDLDTFCNKAPEEHRSSCRSYTK